MCWRGECPFVRWIMSVCAVDNVRHVKTGEGENVRPVKKMRWQMTSYALFDEGENARGGKCPVTVHYTSTCYISIAYILSYM